MLVSLYLISRPLKTRTIFLRLLFMDKGKASYPLIIFLQANHQNSAVAGLLIIPAHADQEGLSLDHQHR